MEQLNSKLKDTTDRPIKVLQFGEGNFLRAFIDWMIQVSNELGIMNTNVCVVQPLEFGRVDALKEQDGLYTLMLEGIDSGEIKKKSQIIDSLSDFINPYTDYDLFLEYAKSEELELIISNTTEAGISLDKTDVDHSSCPKSYPGKLLALLKNRYDYFAGATDKGLEIVPCELIDYNGDKLKAVLVELSELMGYSTEFIEWLITANNYANTLVDRIVPGYPKNNIDEIQSELGYIDNSVVKGEIFHLFVVNGSKRLRQIMPFDQAGLSCLFVDEIKPYKERKVKILNGSHTAMVPVSYLYGIDTVSETVNDEILSQFVINTINEEIIPTIDLSEDEKCAFAEAVIERYKNPYIRHELLSISLNSMTKYVTRILPSVLDYIELNQELPNRLIFALSALMVFYKGERDGEEIILKDDPFFLDFWQENWKKHESGELSTNDLVNKFLSMESHFGIDLTTIKELPELVTYYVDLILNTGMKQAVKTVL